MKRTTSALQFPSEFSSRLLIAAVIAATIGFGADRARAAELLPKGFRECATHEDRDQRLACFDAEVARLASEAAKEQNFGTDSGDLARQKAAQDTDRFESISAKVTGIATRPHGELVLTLDNGQVWAQTQALAQFAIEAGDSVRIKAGAFSAYILIAPSGRTTRVTRVK
ncbi:MAG TPA: hypothetical protein VGN07_04325 [Steroidobacteraceae bacterium]